MMENQTSTLRHFMIDLETVGLSEDACVWQGAIVEFWLNSQGTFIPADGSHYYFFMNPYEATKRWEAGDIVVDERTVLWQENQRNVSIWQWWAQQTGIMMEERRRKYMEMTSHLPIMPDIHPAAQTYYTLDMKGLFSIIKKLAGPDTHFWAKGKEFEMKLLTYMFGMIGETPPWHYTNFHCVRDICALPDLLKSQKPARAANITHNAWEDAVAQIEQLHHAVNQLWLDMQGAV